MYWCFVGYLRDFACGHNENGGGLEVLKNLKGDVSAVDKPIDQCSNRTKCNNARDRLAAQVEHQEEDHCVAKHEE